MLYNYWRNNYGRIIVVGLFCITILFVTYIVPNYALDLRAFFIHPIKQLDDFVILTILSACVSWQIRDYGYNRENLRDHRMIMFENASGATKFTKMDERSRKEIFANMAEFNKRFRHFENVSSSLHLYHAIITGYYTLCVSIAVLEMKCVCQIAM